MLYCSSVSLFGRPMASKIEVTIDKMIPKRNAHQKPSTLKPSTI